MLFTFSIYLIIFSLYLLWMVLIFAGLLRLKRHSERKMTPGREVTVVIPFKNELDHLPSIIRDLEAQDYPGHLFSVLMVNDHSDDGSGALVKSLLEKHETFSCLDLPDEKEGKKNAISFALSRAESPWIIQTDADCRLGPGFISAHMKYLEEHPSELVAGFVSIRDSDGGFL